MKGYGWISLISALILGMVFVGQFNRASAKQPKILEFDSMVGLPQAFTGTQNSALMRGINGGGLPWMIGSSHGELKANGELEIRVQGLVLAAGQNIGKNPVANFRATVSCLTIDAGVVNVSTDMFPATLGLASDGGGNADIEATLSLPHPCLAPIIFVTNPNDAWFATTGQ